MAGQGFDREGVGGARGCSGCAPGATGMVRWRSATAVGASELDERRWSERRSWRIGGRQRGGTSTATKSENVVFDIPVVEAARAIGRGQNEGERLSRSWVIPLQESWPSRLPHARATPHTPPRWRSRRRARGARPMAERLRVTLNPRAAETRILMMEGRDERMRAVLGPATGTHPRAAETLLEGLALWHQRALSVVLCADVEDGMSALRLEDALGFGARSMHFEVEVALRGSRRRPRRICGLGSFSDLRQLCLLGVTP